MSAAALIHLVVVVVCCYLKHIGETLPDSLPVLSRKELALHVANAFSLSFLTDCSQILCFVCTVTAGCMRQHLQHLQHLQHHRVAQVDRLL